MSYLNNYTIDRTFRQTYKRTFDFDIYLSGYPYLGAAYNYLLHLFGGYSAAGSDFFLHGL